MVQQIVPRGDLIKHGAHSRRYAGFIPGPFGLSSRRHSYLLLSESCRM